jgi:hypothetical protein
MTKTTFIHFRANNYEIAMIKTMADLEHRNLSEMLRELVREAYTNRNINSPRIFETGMSGSKESWISGKEVPMT